MLWSSSTDLTGIWAGNVNTSMAQGSSYALGFNEPDQCGGGGACMTNASATAASYKTWMNGLPSSLKLGAPAVTNGGSPMGLTYLQDFLGNCTGCRVDFCTVHWYDSYWNTGYFKNHINDAYAACGSSRPIWITEFAPVDGTDDDKAGFLNTVLPWLDAQPFVQRYAYQMASAGALLTADGKNLSSIGSVYATY